MVPCTAGEAVTRAETREFSSIYGNRKFITAVI
jgi:hypothetical protein